MKRKGVLIMVFCAIVLFGLSLYWHSIMPSNDRVWSVDQQVLPYSVVVTDTAYVYNVRNFTYYNTSLYYPAYYTGTYNLSQLDSTWYIVEPFSQFGGSAHTFLSFGFNDTYLAVSVEIRKEQGETFSAFKGLFKQYELMYVLGDENDLIKLRSNYRKDKVYLYPVNTTHEAMEQLFLDILARVNGLYQTPEFYNTLSNTCTTNIARHVNRISHGRVPFNIALLLPGYSDKFAYNLGLINTTLPYDAIRDHYSINERAMNYANDSQFSARIRGLS